MSEHRVTMLGASWRRLEDPARSRDPRIRALVGALATLPSEAPSDEFRAELRAQLVAIAPRIISESLESSAPLVEVVPGTEPAPRRGTATAPRHTDSVFARIRRLRIGRPLAIVASVVTAFALLLGGAVVMSRNALPGDTLYGLKRASENVELALAGSNTEKARDYLKFAGTRVSEVQGLLSRANGNVDSHTASLITSTLASSDSDVRSASSLLGKQAVESKSASPLAVITAWAPTQLSKLQRVAAAMPDTQLRDVTDSSAALVNQVVTRANQLAPKLAVGCLSTSATDAIGPLPMSTCGVLPSGTPTGTLPHPSLSATRGGGTARHGSTVPNVTGVVPNGSVSASPSGAGGGSSSQPVVLPSLPLPSVGTSLPVSVKTCSVGVNIGPININIGSCSP